MRILSELTAYSYVLESNGDILEVNPNTALKAITYKFPVDEKIEFESLVWYKNINKLVLISKDQRKKSCNYCLFL